MPRHPAHRCVWCRLKLHLHKVVNSCVPRRPEFCGPTYSDLYRPAQLRCQWTAYMEQLTRSLTFTGPLVALIQAPAEVLPVPSLGVRCPNNRPAPMWLYSEFGAAYINIQNTDLPTYLNSKNTFSLNHSHHRSSPLHQSYGRDEDLWWDIGLLNGFLFSSFSINLLVWFVQ